jgi:hypothetical protein
MNRLMVLLLASAVSIGYAYKARVDFDHGASFGNYKTYSWAKMPDAAGEEGLFPNQLMRERIAGFIEEALAVRKLSCVSSGGDLQISYRITVEEEPQWVTFGDGFGPGWGWDGGLGWGTGISTTTMQAFYNGTLIINLVDANRSKLVFQGASTQDISSKPEKNSKRFCKAVNEIFDKYPPRP